MKKLLYLHLSLTITCLFSTSAFVTFCQPKTVSPRKLKLVWSDEFNYTGLPDSGKWGYHAGGHGFGNRELQYYTKSQPKNARVADGLLVIEAHKEAMDTNRFTSAKLITRGKGDWMYGRIEVQAKLPSGKGTWPAIWMLASTNPLKWPDDGEIDIMEHVGFNQGSVHGTVHTKAYNHKIHTEKGGKTLIPDASAAFHVYTIEWTPDKIDWYVDDKKYYTFANDQKGSKDTWPFNQPFYLILNLAVGGNWGGQKGVDESIFPQRMEVDYVRIYQ